MTWFYSNNGQQLGPITDQELTAKFRNGELSSTDLVWKEGMSDWKPLGEVNLFSAGPMTQMPRSMEGSVMLQQPPIRTSAPIRPNIPTYLWQSIVATVLCCMPFGVVAIVYAAKVDSLIAVGDYVGAQSASKSAKTWVGVSVGIFLLLFVGYFGLIAIGIIFGNI